jgi:dynactin complex subunit
LKAKESMSLPVGSRVQVSGKPGTVRFIGETQFAAGEWYGVELDASEGKNDGTTNGVVYFPCQPNHGVFVRKIQV